MTLAQIRDAVDAKLAPLWTQIQARQAVYAANHDGRYWQGLRTATLCPADGEESAPDLLNSRPHYQAETWAEMGDLGAALPMLLWCDQYRSPDGTFGFVVTVQVRVGANTYERAAQVGPETSFAYGWRRVIEDL